MNVIVTTAVATEVVSVAEAKAHLRVQSGSSEDTYIGTLIAAARVQAEHQTDRSIGAQTLLGRMTGWCEVELVRGPVTAISSVKYDDENDDEQTLSSSYYYLDKSGPVERLRFVPGVSLPTLSLRADNVRIAYTAGYTSADAKIATVKQWILLCVAEMYEHREKSAEKVAEEHRFVSGLLDPIRAWGV